MERWTQTHIDVAGIVMGRRDQFARYEGCLLVAMTNIIRQVHEENIRVSDIDNILDFNSGYTQEGYIRWNVLEDCFNFKHVKHDKDKFGRIEFSSDSNKFWIVQTEYGTTGHFSEVIDHVGDTVFFFDSYNGEKNHVQKKNCISIREITFEVKK